jgi:hypothetical protein
MYAIIRRMGNSPTVYTVTGRDGDLVELDGKDVWWDKDELIFIDKAVIQRAVRGLLRTTM